MVMAKGEHSGAKDVKPPVPKPQISLSDLIFVIHVDTDGKTIALVRRGKDLEFGSNDRFHIQVENLSYLGVSKSAMDDVTIKWEVMYNDDSEDVVTIVDARRSLDRNFGWLIKDLVAPQGLIKSGLVADVKVSFNGDLLDKIGLEIFNERNRAYFSAADTLRYLACFFL